MYTHTHVLLHMWPRIYYIIYTLLHKLYLSYKYIFTNTNTTRTSTFIIIIGVPAPAKAIFVLFGPKRCIFQIFFSYHFYSKFADTRYLPTLVTPSGASIHTGCPHFRTPSMCYPAKRRPTASFLVSMF